MGHSAASMSDSLMSMGDSLMSERQFPTSESDSLMSERQFPTSENDFLMSENEFLMSESDSLMSESDSLMSESDSLMSENDSLMSENDSLTLFNTFNIKKRIKLIQGARRSSDLCHSCNLWLNSFRIGDPACRISDSTYAASWNRWPAQRWKIYTF